MNLFQYSSICDDDWIDGCCWIQWLPHLDRVTCLYFLELNKVFDIEDEDFCFRLDVVGSSSSSLVVVVVVVVDLIVVVIEGV
jgi:hypothetical protein